MDLTYNIYFFFIKSNIPINDFYLYSELFFTIKNDLH